VETLRFDIQARDFTGAGAASRALKQHLKRIGAESETVRRAVIAAYEAEMNVVIHAAQGGVLEAAVDEGQLDVSVSDGGPGIPDIEAAMREGFSTAPPEARALGFGAGLGLPNIRRNSDRLRVTSEVGKGTTVSFTILLRAERGARDERPTSLVARAALCRDCRRCVLACPTGAVRVRDGAPTVLGHLCVDCAACIAACTPRALTVAGSASPPSLDGATVVVPPGVLVDYYPFGGPGAALAALRALGAVDVVVTHGYEAALRAAVSERAAAPVGPSPVVSPVCPGVVALIELRFPALLPHLAPLASPLEAAQLDLADADAVFVVSCPGQRSALLAQRPTAQGAITTPGALRKLLAPLVAAGQGPPAPAPSGSRPTDEDDVLVVTGAGRVVAVLDQLENGLLTDVPVVEPYLCDGGCLGSPLLQNEPSLSAWRWAAADVAAGGRAHERRLAYQPRPGIRLDPDMATAIRKLTELERVADGLPGKDCTVCGAPTCAAFAEDVITGRAARDLCPYAAQASQSGARPDEERVR